MESLFTHPYWPFLNQESLEETGPTLNPLLGTQGMVIREPTQACDYDMRLGLLWLHVLRGKAAASSPLTHIEPEEQAVRNMDVLIQKEPLVHVRNYTELAA